MCSGIIAIHNHSLTFVAPVMLVLRWVLDGLSVAVTYDSTVSTDLVLRPVSKARYLMDVDRIA